MRKNILIFGHNDGPQFIDIYNQYTRLYDPTEYNVTVVYLTAKTPEATRERTFAKDVIFLNASKKSIRGLKIGPILKLLALCRERQFQQVICHRYKPIYIMMWIAQFVSIPALIFVMHELKTMSSIHRRLLAAFLYRPNMIFAGVSNAVRDDLRRDMWRVPKENIVTLYNVMDVELTEPTLYSREEARQTLGLPDDAFVFGNVARLVPNKDQATLIRAFAAIKHECPNTKLILLGDGSLEQALKDKVKSLWLENDIIFTGYIDKGYRYMRAFDCFVLSSIQEAFGRVLLEAMIAKLPIIATTAHGIPEVMGNVGKVIPPGDKLALATAMKETYALSAVERQELGEEAYTHMHQQYALPVFHQRFWALPLIQSLTS